MAELVTYELADGTATITMDDRKVNVLSLEMFWQIHAALDRAESDGSVVILTGRQGVFSAGFDLAVLRGGGARSQALVRTGFELAERRLGFPRPVVVACNGHAVAMGVFLVLSGDFRIGVEGEYRVGPNEVVIGLTMPRFAIEICHQRLAPAYFNRALVLAEPFSGEEAVAAGFFDRIVPADRLLPAAAEVAQRLRDFDAETFRASKLRIREDALRRVRAAIEADATSAAGGGGDGSARRSSP
ncbi:MAG: crotonase/enoyl-CoA hydratase family protein [Hyphomicrobiales bacterium]